MVPRILSGLAEVAEDYDLIICDVWGVLHNSIAPYPGVLDCLGRAAAHEKRIALLSNAPRPNSVVAGELERIGIAEGMYDHLVTSGEATRRALVDRSDAWYARLGRRFFHLGPPRCHPTVEGIGEEAELSDADFIVCTGLFDDEADHPDDYHDLLRPAIERGLPLICANPDIVVMRGDRLIPCAGGVAKLYGEWGGEVRWHGKPHTDVYDIIFRLSGVERDCAVMIGDGFHTDIEGACRAGIDSIWIAGGIHADEVGYREGNALDADRVAKVIAESGELPSAVLARLVW